jgi:hypothetical protein
MSYGISDHGFQHVTVEELEQYIAHTVAKALQEKYGDLPMTVKKIAREIGADPRTIRNWYKGEHAPKTVHLLLLAKSLPSIMRMVLHLMERPDLWEYCKVGALQPAVSNTAHAAAALPPVYYERNFVINVTLHPAVTGKLNPRQLWFLGLLQCHHKIKPDDIASTWNVSTRTAQADIAGLVAAGLVHLVGSRKTGWYEAV